MTTPDPLEDIKVPYSVSFMAVAGTPSAQIPEAERQTLARDTWHRFLEGSGTYLVSFSYNGSEAAELNHFKNGSTGTTWETIAKIDPGSAGVPRGSSAVMISAAGGLVDLRIRINDPVGPSAASVDMMRVAVLHIIPIPNFTS